MQNSSLSIIIFITCLPQTPTDAVSKVKAQLHPVFETILTMLIHILGAPFCQ